MWEVLLTVGLQVVGWLLDRAKVSKEAKERFFEFVTACGNDVKSTKLMEYGEKQLEWLNNNPWDKNGNT